MPVGPFPTFQDCVTAMQKKGKSKDAAGAICGAMEKQSQGSVDVKDAFSSWQHCQEVIGAHYDKESTDNICGHLKSIGQAEVNRLAAMSWEECISKARDNPKVNDPEKLCGWLKNYGPNASVPKTAASNDKFFVKAFLLDASLNINRWRVSPESIDRNINTFIGKPLVLTEEFDHPAPQGQETLNHWLAFQETFRVGTIIDITTKKNPLTGNPGYYAVIEVTNPDLRQSLADNKVPLYVSPAIAELVTPKQMQSAGLRLQDGSELVDNWVGVHLAIVSEPAFGVRKAVISETCGGDEAGCLLQLRKASIEKYGAGKCGFCVKKALVKYADLRKLAAFRPNLAASNTGNVSTSSHPVNQASNGRKMSTLEPNDQSTNGIGSQSEQTVEKVEQRSPPLTQAPIQPQIINKQPVPTSPPGSYSIPDLLQKVSLLEQQIQLKDVKIEELSNVNNTFGERVASLEMERRREKIERIITSEVIKDQKSRLEKINYFTASSIPIEEIEALYKDVKVAIKKASANVPRGRVPYLGTSMGSSGIASPGAGTTITLDDDTGLTPLQKQMAVLRGGP